MKRWLFNILYNADRFISSVLLGRNPQDTLSSRLARNRDNGGWIGKVGCRILDWLDPGHCKRSQ